ncbi:MAG: O-antigen ligase family protein [Candidatus Doudnabacteria bacterium]|nr:O-antigen ligase family protein [Candidatus Doudnabacteria bacterium]
MEMLILLLYIANLRVKKDLELGLSTIFVSAVFQAGLAWAQFHVQGMIGLRFLGEYISPLGTSGLSSISTATGKVIRAYGTFPHPNVLGAFLVLGLAVGINYVSRATYKLRILGNIGLILMLIGIFTTFSRTAWIASTIIILANLAYLSFKGQKRIAVYILINVIVSCATIFTLYSSSLKARAEDPSTASIEDRSLFNKLGIEIFKQSPLFGSGAGNYIPEMLDRYNLEPWQYQPPHNIIIYILAELGIAGLIAFIWILKGVLRGAKKIFTDNLSFTIYLSAIIFLFMGQLDHYFVTIQQGRLLFAVALGLALAVPNIYDYKKSN